jgi:hypothetical protein
MVSKQSIVGVRVVLILAVLNAVLLPSVTGLKCCQCTYMDTKPIVNECNCKTNPEKKDCRSNPGTPQPTPPNNVDACMFSTGLLRGTKQAVYVRMAGSSEKKAPPTCHLEAVAFKADDLDFNKSCFCSSDWCNCDDGLSSGSEALLKTGVNYVMAMACIIASHGIF